MTLPVCLGCRSTWKTFFTLLACVLASGCATWLPEAHTDTTPFNSFEEARASVEALVPMRSDRKALESNGFAPSRHPNTIILTHADVVRRFVPSGLLRREDLDVGVLTCLEARDACKGMEVLGAKIHKARKGGFWADFLNFERRTETTGFRFNALVLMVNDLVVYRSWSGQPAVSELEVTRNPLGPFQDIGPPTVTNAAPIR